MTMTVKVEVIGAEKVIKRIEEIENLDTNPILKRHIRNAGENSRSYWKRNVYSEKFFHKRLSNDLPVSNDFKNSIRISSKDPMNVKITRLALTRGESGISGGPTSKDYGEYILYGTKPSPGLYSYFYDKKLTHGQYAMAYTPGVDKSIGRRWLSNYFAYVDKMYNKKYEQAVIDIIEGT